MTLQEHHWIMLGVLALCYEHVPIDLKLAIKQGIEAAKNELGLPVNPENLGTGKALCGNIQ